MRSRLLRLSIVVMIFILLSLWGIFILFSRGRNAPASKLRFSFTEVNGRKIESSRYLGQRPVLVLCLDPDCSACREEVLDIAQNHSLICRFSFILIAESDRATALRLFNGMPFILKTHADFIVDSARAAQQYFGKHSLPSTYLYKKNGCLVKYWRGEVSWNGLSAVLTKIDRTTAP